MAAIGRRSLSLSLLCATLLHLSPTCTLGQVLFRPSHTNTVEGIDIDAEDVLGFLGHTHWKFRYSKGIQCETLGTDVVMYDRRKDGSFSRTVVAKGTRTKFRGVTNICPTITVVMSQSEGKHSFYIASTVNGRRLSLGRGDAPKVWWLAACEIPMKTGVVVDGRHILMGRHKKRLEDESADNTFRPDSLVGYITVEITTRL